MRNSYGYEEMFRNGISLIYTKLFMSKARLIRRPFFIRGKKYLEYKKGFTTGYNCRIEMFDTGKGAEKKLLIGENCKIGDNVHIASGELVSIGNNCLIASKVYISDVNHGDYTGHNEYSSPYLAPDNRKIYTNPVYIGENVWIGENVCILPGVKIGDGCVIGANSVVNRDIPHNCIVAGTPAKVIKKYNDETKKWERVLD